jgi:O-Antigen ligase
MIFYYILLVMTRFHFDPRIGKALFDTGIVLVTPVKIAGLLTVLLALFLPTPVAAAPRLPSPQSILFVFFAILPVHVSLAFSLPLPSTSISSLISFAFLMVATHLLVRTEDRMRKTVRVMILASALASLWIFKQHFLQHFDRPGGMEQDPNYEALTLVTGIPLAIWMARHEISRWWTLIGAGCAGLMGLGVLITESRAGLIALGVTALVAVVLARRKILTLALLAVAAIIVVGFAPSGLLERFHGIKISGAPTNGDEESTRIHFELLKAGISMIGSNPLLGVGLDQFKSVAPDYNPNLNQVGGRSYIAHDTYIQVAAECGLPILALFLALIGLAMLNCSAARRSTNTALADLGFAMQLGLIAYGVAAASVTAEYVITLWLIIFLSQNLRDICAATTEPIQSAASRQPGVSVRPLRGISRSSHPSIQRISGRRTRVGRESLAD